MGDAVRVQANNKNECVSWDRCEWNDIKDKNQSRNGSQENNVLSVESVVIGNIISAVEKI